MGKCCLAAMSRRSGVATASYPCLLAASDAEQDKNRKDTQLAAETDNDKKEKKLQAGAPLWAGIWLFLTHVAIGFFMSSCCMYIPYIGETPVWIRIVILLNAVGSGFCDHLGVYMLQPSKLEPFSKVYIPLGLLFLILYFVNIGTVLPAWESMAVIFLNVVAIAGPAVAYKKITGKDPPATYEDAQDSCSTWAGLMAHLATDTMLVILFVMSWKLMDPSRLQGEERFASLLA